MKRLVALALIVLGCVLMGLGSALVGGVVLWREGDLPDAYVWRSPLELVDARALVSDTVLLPLTGASADEALDAALARAHLDNAFALVAYEPFLDDTKRLGALLQLGTRYTSAKNTRQAARAFQIAAQFATLSPLFSDATRLDAYMQASAGLRSLGAQDAARWVTDQAYRLAAYAPTLQREQRARRLEQIANAYAALNASTLSEQARQAAETVQATTVPITRTRAPFVPSSGKLPTAPEVEAARARRIAIAQRLYDDVLDRAPKRAQEWDADLLGELRNALLDEDRARQAYYEAQRVQWQDDGMIAWRREQIAWLTLQYRIARGAFGVALVPEWEKEHATIARVLSEAWEEYLRVAYAQATRLPSLERAPAQLDVLLHELLVVRWGWHTTQSEQVVIEKISTVTQDLMEAAYPALRFDSITRNKQRLFIWLPDELYGRGERALPK